MTNTAGFAWVTQADVVDRVRHDVESGRLGETDLATELHNRIGMPLLKLHPEQWVQVCYPADAFQAQQLRPPTFLDGANAAIYRSHCRADGWGETVNLSNTGPGLPEAVHRAVPFTEEFCVVSLGWNNYQTVQVNWASFVQGMLHKWSDAAAWARQVSCWGGTT
jgi:hypothetical protein